MAKIGKRVYGPYNSATWATPSVSLPQNDGFIVDVDGTIYCAPQGQEDYQAPGATSAAAPLWVALPVKGSQVYPISLGKVSVASCSTMTTFWLVAGENR